MSRQDHQETKGKCQKKSYSHSGLPPASFPGDAFLPERLFTCGLHLYNCRALAGGDQGIDHFFVQFNAKTWTPGCIGETFFIPWYPGGQIRRNIGVRRFVNLMMEKRSQILMFHLAHPLYGNQEVILNCGLDSRGKQTSAGDR